MKIVVYRSEIEMSRPPRRLSETGLYHVIFRGINRMDIFEEEADYNKFLEIMQKQKDEFEFEIYAYCLMTNHVHIFIKEKRPGDIKKIMHKALTSYVVWYNRKYQRSGSLVGNRYKSEPIEDEDYYFALVRYIHQNPVRAGISLRPSEYKWSSYRDYVYGLESITDTDFTLSILSENMQQAITLFEELHWIEEPLSFTATDSKKLTPSQVKRKIEKISGIKSEEIASLVRGERNRILMLLRESGLSIGQIERATGISRGIIGNVNKREVI